MTNLATGLPINNRDSDAKITPALRLAVQKATSVFQKDFCYDFLQAIVDEPEIADPIGVRLFLNFCLRKPDNLIDSFLDSLDQNLGSPDNFSENADTILIELENFIEFVHHLIEMIDGGEIFRLAYHEIDAWKLCYQLLEPIQRRLFDLAVKDRMYVSDHTHESIENGVPPEPTFSSESASSGFYQSFVTIDKFLKHSLESRILLEPAKLVEDADQLIERRTELQGFRAMFPSTQNSTLLVKKHGRFGREEATIDQFIESEKFKELSKLKATMSGGQLTRQPSTRTKKSSIKLENHTSNVSESNLETKHSNNKTSPAYSSELEPKTKRTLSTAPLAVNKRQTEAAHLDPFLRERASPHAVGKPAFVNKELNESDSNSDIGIVQNVKKSSNSGKPGSQAESNASTKRQGSIRQSVGSTTATATTGVSTTSTSAPRRKRNSRPGGNQKDDQLNNSKRKKNRKSKSDKPNDDDDGQEELFVVDKIIGESVDIKGEVIYKVLWAGYPESEATWQFANTLDDCEALDIWQQNKLKETSTDQQQHKNGNPPQTTTSNLDPAITASSSYVEVVVETNGSLGLKEKL